MAAKKAKKRTSKKTSKRSKVSPVEKAMKAARQASAKRIMAQWHEKSAKLNAECQLALNRLKSTSKAAKSVVKLRVL